MACSLKTGLYVSGSNQNILGGILRNCPTGSLQFKVSQSKFLWGKLVLVADHKGLRDCNPKFSIKAQSSICNSRAMRWWEKALKTNIIEINSSQELVDSLLIAGDKLVIVDFYSPGCGGCITLNPKICQLAESNPNAIFLKVNCEELKKMCHSLHIHVLPFFRFYRGSEGRLCSFSCTNATIKKFKDALAKHGTERCNIGPAKGLDESELLSLASIGEISINLPLSTTREAKMEDLVLKNLDLYRKRGLEQEMSAILMA
ncbi:thioredoxin-like 1-2, chloroplastic [Actinidia eriantha]|uniref:thioredoxin-like 1-2, chloroplastic n=1 Tax=Actinidia eriantha TaxID=165200 RepID=UPI00258D0BE0|nr:thioredoxin-like 1-2, chloroplastic [Actinidia eriantha]XP_057474686.1 thioredoxin-like 1-2, chloroplastic [Actinidia eriantha]